MENKAMAKALARKCFQVNLDDDDFAVQLFIEKVCLPNDFTKSYSVETIEFFILSYLNTFNLYQT